MSQAAKMYREKVGHPVISVVIGMTATNFTVNAPDDPHGLDVCGFDSSVPSIIQEFVK